MNGTRPFPLLALASIAAIVVAACGGGSEAPVPTTTRAPTSPAGVTAAPTTAPQATARPQATVAPQTTVTSVAIPRGTLDIAIASAITDFNPGLFTGGLGEYLTMVLDFMVWHADDARPAPGVLASWDMSADGRIWTLKIRPGMKFSDGSNVTATDIKFSLDHMAGPIVRYANFQDFQNRYGSTEAVDATTARMTMKNPDGLVSWDLSPRSRKLNGLVMQKADADRQGHDKPWTKVMGTGPWKAVDIRTDQKITFEANRNPHPYRVVPGYAVLEVLRVPEESTRIAGAQTGQLDISEMLPLSANRVKGQGLQIFESPATGMGGVHFPGLANPELWKTKPTSNIKVRMALTHAVDRQAIVNVLLQGFGEVSVRWAIQPTDEGFDPIWKLDLGYDPARAKQLLAEAGYPNGFELEIFVSTGGSMPWLGTAMEAIAGMWANIGVRTKTLTGSSQISQRPQVIAVGTALMLPSFSRGQPISGLNSYYGTGAQIGLWARPDKIPQLFIDARAALTEAERVRITREIVNLAQSEYLSIPIAISGNLYAANANVTGWKPIYSLPGIGNVAERVRPK